MTRPQIDTPDIDEKGAPTPDTAGEPQRSSERLFMQLMAFGDCPAIKDGIIAELSGAGIDGVLYEDVSDPSGVALLTMARDPAFFVDRLRPVLRSASFAPLTLKPEYTMFGRTYSLGYEPDLSQALFERPRRHALNPDWPWAIWYPLRRGGAFERLSGDERREVLMEHGRIGMSYGAADYAHDIRLACHGLDKNDNDFVIGLTGRELAPLSKLVQAMRSTVQTSMYLERLGPFFVGRAVWQAKM